MVSGAENELAVPGEKVTAKVHVLPDATVVVQLFNETAKAPDGKLGVIELMLPEVELVSV